MKNILILSPDAPKNGMGGLGVHLDEVLKRVDTTLYNVTAICQGATNYVYDNGIKVYGLYATTSIGLENDAYIRTFINQSKFISLVNSLLLAGEIEKPDVIHIMDWTTAIAGEELANQFGAKIVFAVHLSINNYINKVHPTQENSHNFATDIEFSMCKKADKVIQVTNYYANLFPFNVFGHKTNVIYNGVDYDAYANADTTALDRILNTETYHERKRVLYLGRFCEMKNVISLILCLEDLPDNVDLVFVGGESGSDQHLLDYIKMLNSKEDNHFYYLGSKYGQDKYDIMASADIIIMPSTHEPFGLVALEALAAGQNGKTLFASSFKDGLGEFLTEEACTKCGVTPYSIKKAIETMLSKSDEEKNAQRTAGCELAKSYSWDICATNIQDVWSEV